jgi:hypothetical protein
LVRHTFTHFHLELTVLAGAVRAGFARGGDWVQLDALGGQALPTVMKKVVAHVRQGPRRSGHSPRETALPFTIARDDRDLDLSDHCRGVNRPAHFPLASQPGTALLAEDRPGGPVAQSKGGTR